MSTSSALYISYLFYFGLKYCNQICETDASLLFLRPGKMYRIDNVALILKSLFGDLYFKDVGPLPEGQKSKTYQPVEKILKNTSTCPKS